MTLGQIQLPLYRSETITRDYLLRGKFQPIGPMQTFLNDESRRFAQFKEPVLAPFSSENPLGKLNPPVVMVRKDDIVAISILDQEGIEAAQLFATKHKMIVYTPRFVIKGHFHMGADDIPLDVLSSSKSDFIGVTETTIYPLQTIQNMPQVESKMMFINRRSVRFYHLLDESG